jgi:hypothetical protein
VTGVAMVKAGCRAAGPADDLAVFAGSAQLAAVPLMGARPGWVIWATALCVNLRFVIFSAQWRPFFMRLPRGERACLGYITADLNYVLFMKRFASRATTRARSNTSSARSQLNWLAWQVPSIARHRAGRRGADAVGPRLSPACWRCSGSRYSLLSDRAPRSRGAWPGAAAVAAFALPFRLHIVVAIAAAVCVGLMIDGGGDAGRRVSRRLIARQGPRGQEACMTVGEVA